MKSKFSKRATKERAREKPAPGGELGERAPRIRVVMMPKDTNAMGHIFGGVILSALDLAAAEHAMRVAPHRYVTKILNAVDFISPVLVGDTVSFYTETIAIGRTSVRIRVLVEAQRGLGKKETIKVTEAEVVMVAVDSRGRPTPIRSQADHNVRGLRRRISR